MDPATGLPVVDEEKCTACGACVKACPKSVIELRNKGRRNMRVFVSCINKDKGAVARKACKAACIGCSKCAKVCPFEAITVENNLAYIDYTKCKLCKKCVAECPTGAIHAVNFPVVKPKPEAAPAQSAPAVTPVISSETEGRDEKSPTYKFIIPMVDARRMEVYTAVFENGKQVTETEPVIVDESSFAEYLEQGPCLFIGDGAGKCADVIKHPNAHFVQCCPKASAMLSPALAAFRAGDFKDVAYFEPFYLKEFVATVSKKKMW
jgi:ferredoxin